MHRLLYSVMILIVVASAPALAQQEPPARVGRVSFVAGNLAFHAAGQTEWSAAAANYPIATGTSLWADADTRAEIRIAPDTLDVASNTELDVAALGERVTQLSIPRGRLHLHLRRLSEGRSFEVDIPRGAIQLLQPGEYDIDAGTEDQPARVAVFEGSARFLGSGADIAIKAGDVAVLNGLSPVTATLEPAGVDDFVEWCRSRDYDEKRLAAPYHVSPDMPGYAELDAYGRWDTAPGFGEVWYPDVPAGWVPYSVGRWVWVAPWGWTWVDAAPWGFAPCHYGRWALIGDSWGWVPGTFEPNPVYAPALVAFLGGPGAGLYVSGAIGPQIGWFPLAPGEVYWPSYNTDPSYIRRLNAANVASIDSIHIPRDGVPPADVASAAFVNRRFATIVSQHVFAGSGRVDGAAGRPSISALEHAPVTMRPPQIRPMQVAARPGPPRFGARGQPTPGTPTLSEHVAPSGFPRGAAPGWHGATAPGLHAAMPSHSVAEQQRVLPRSSGRLAGMSGHAPQLHAFREPPRLAHLPQPARPAGRPAQPHVRAFSGPPQVAHLPQAPRPAAPGPAHHGGGAPARGSTNEEHHG